MTAAPPPGAGTGAAEVPGAVEDPGGVEVPADVEHPGGGALAAGLAPRPGSEPGRAAGPERGPVERLDGLLGRPVSMRALALLRVLVGPLAALHLWSVAGEAHRAASGAATFTEPYASWYPVLSPQAQAAVLTAGALAALALAVGWHSRPAAVATFAAVAYHLGLSTTHVHNNRAFLAVVLAGLAVGPCGRELSVDSWRRRRRGRPPRPTNAPGWPLWLLRFEASALYGASGLSKLVDPDWFGGTVTWLRAVHHRGELAASPLPGWLLDVLVDRDFHTYAAKVVVLTELFVAVGLWWPPVRRAAVWVAVAFHVAIQLSASVEVFSYLAIAALVIWATPSVRDRVLVIDPTAARHRRLAAAVRALDWLARFRVVPGRRGDPLRVHDRDGTTVTGGPALVLVLSRLPLTAWPALPALLAPPVRRSRRSRRPGPAGPMDPVDPVGGTGRSAGDAA